ncbi:MAG: HLH transcription factor (gamma), partial [Lasallia pustulata]
ELRMRPSFSMRSRRMTRVPFLYTWTRKWTPRTEAYERRRRPLTGNNGQGRSGLISMGGTLSPQSLSPGVQEGGSGANSGRGEPQFWSHSGRESLSFKEEDEYGMDMN